MIWIVVILALIGIGGIIWWRTKSQKSGFIIDDDVTTRVNLMVTMPKVGVENKQVKDLIAPMETIFDSLSGIRDSIGNRSVIFELATEGEQIVFYVNVPAELQDFVEKQITSQYADAAVDVAPYPNIFPEQGRVSATQLVLKKDISYPIQTYNRLETDGMSVLANALSKLVDMDAGAAVQILIRPTTTDVWQKRAQNLARTMLQGKESDSIAQGVAKGLKGIAVREDEEKKPNEPKRLSSLQEEVVSAIENKANKPGFETVIRLVAAAPDEVQSKSHLRALVSGFLQFGATELNSFVEEKVNEQDVIRSYVMRQFGKLGSTLLNSEELATIFHFPHGLLEVPNLKWLRAKRLPAPDNLPKSGDGVLIGKNSFRGVTKQIHMQRDDRRRHTYMVGKTGTGKSSWLQNMALQDIINGEGVCFIDPHGDAIEWLLERIPKHRVEDVIHFYPPDLDRPLGLNLLEAKNTTEKDMVVSEMISIFYKLFDPQGSGIVGPIFEHYMRNAMLLLMADPSGSATLIDIPRVLTDREFRLSKLKYVTDPTVLRFWNEEFAEAEKNKSIGEIFSYLVSKIGRFISNEMMRNIVGQPKSSFDLRQVMDGKKILLVNLAKGLTGDINSNMLGFIIVSKLQMAALSRADRANKDYPDFYLYIDEFQNVTTDSIATILSEARKYRLNMIVAHQYMAQLDEKIADAVLGNVGTMVAFRVGAPDAERLVKEFAPEVSEHDLVNIEKFNAYIKLMIDGTASKPFTLQTLPPMGEGNEKIGEAIKQLSRLKFGVDKRIVESQLSERIKYKGLSGGEPPVI
ncbi:MAG: TraM recognition domain-containing protein [Patescibacteria group bacterium]